MKGQNPPMPAPGFSWKDIPALNEDLSRKYKDSSFDDIIARLKASHQRVISLLDKNTDEELFEKKRYHWTGSTSLGVYFRGSLSSHYTWANALIKKWQRRNQ
jgi:hypothetical protein